MPQIEWWTDDARYPLMHTGQWPPVLDHVDRNRTNNRIENLRVATRVQNAVNSKSFRGDMRGVCKSGKRFLARIGVNYKQVYLGTFDTIEEAREAYVTKAKELWGEFTPEEPCRKDDT